MIIVDFQKLQRQMELYLQQHSPHQAQLQMRKEQMICLLARHSLHSELMTRLDLTLGPITLQLTAIELLFTLHLLMATI